MLRLHPPCIFFIVMVASFVTAEEPTTLRSRIKAAAPKVDALRDSQMEMKAIKAVEATIEGWRGNKAFHDRNVEALRTEIAGFIPFRYRNNLQIEYGLQKEAELLEQVRNSNAASEAINHLRSQIPSGVAHRELLAREEKARREYQATFPGLIEAADADAKSGMTDRVEIIGEGMRVQGWQDRNIAIFSEDLKAFMLERDIPARRSDLPANPVRIMSALGMAIDCKEAVGGGVSIRPREGGSTQSWALEKAGADLYFIVSTSDGRTLQASSDRSKVVLGVRADAATQKWKLLNAGGNLIIENLAARRVIDVNQSAQGAMILYPKHGQINQLWSIKGFDAFR